MPTGPLRVLVVDDEPDWRVLLRAVVAPAIAEVPVEVVEAGTVHDAVRELAEPVDLVLLDLGLPDVVATDLLAGLRAVASATPQVPIIVLTAGDELLGPRAVRAGADDFVHKSQVQERLPEVARLTLARAARRSEAGAAVATDGAAAFRAFAAALLHEVRTPLATAMLGLETLGDPRLRLDDAAAHDVFARVRGQLARLAASTDGAYEALLASLDDAVPVRDGVVPPPADGVQASG